MRVRRWIRRMIPRWEDPLLALAVVGGYWILPIAYVPRDLANDPRQRGAWDARLPPGHPECPAHGQPLSPAERDLWAALEGIDW
jgi:hypothetical protein